MDREKMGALTDGIYAIAMTILALELPLPDTTQELTKSFQDIAFIVVDYGLTFILLFAFWYNQRRINDLLEIHKRGTLLLNAVILMLVCLVPFSATLLYQLGQTTTLFGANYATLVDLIELRDFNERALSQSVIGSVPS